MVKKKNSKSEISNRPLDPTMDYEEYIGGEGDDRAGLTINNNREPGEDIKLTDKFKSTSTGMVRKD